MARYIDADALIVEHSKIEIDGLVFKHSWGEIYKNLRKAIENAPTADVVEVVRCKDCKHLYRVHSCVYRVDGVGYKNVSPDDFCSYGERNLSESPTD